MPTSSAVITQRTTAIVTYWNGDGCGRSSPGSMGSSSEVIADMPWVASAARSPGPGEQCRVVLGRMVSSVMFRPYGMR